MNEYFEENKRSLIILGIMLFLLTAVIYFVLLRPLLNDYHREKVRVNGLKNEIELLEAQIENLKDSSDEVDLEQLILENKVPSERELDEYILALQQLELHTESRIETIQFAYDSSFDVQMDGTASEEPEAEPEAATDEELEGESAESQDREGVEADAEVSVDPELLNEKPEQLQVLTVRIEGLSPNFDQFIDLLEIIESHERISIVTSLHFTKPTEEEMYFTDDPSELITFEAELTTFYFAE